MSLSVTSSTNSPQSYFSISPCLRWREEQLPGQLGALEKAGWLWGQGLPSPGMVYGFWIVTSLLAPPVLLNEGRNRGGGWSLMNHWVFRMGLAAFSASVSHLLPP